MVDDREGNACPPVAIAIYLLPQQGMPIPEWLRLSDEMVSQLRLTDGTSETTHWWNSQELRSQAPPEIRMLFDVELLRFRRNNTKANRLWMP